MKITVVEIKRCGLLIRISAALKEGDGKELQDILENIRKGGHCAQELAEFFNQIGEDGQIAVGEFLTQGGQFGLLRLEDIALVKKLARSLSCSEETAQTIH